MSISKFICLRYFIIPIEKHLFTEPVDRETLQGWLREALFTKFDFPSPKDFEFAVRPSIDSQKGIDDDSGSLVFGKFCKKKLLDIGRITSSDVIVQIEDDWHSVGFVCDMRPGHQLLLIELDRSIIRGAGIFKKYLEEVANSRMFAKGYSVAFELIVEEKAFWHLVDTADGIYSLQLKLHSPNLFGAGNDANIALKGLRGKFNNTSVDVKLTNEKGKLAIPRREIDPYRNYADLGGGWWKLIISRKKRKMAHRSSDQALTITIEAEKGADPEVLKQALGIAIDKLK